MKKTRTLIFLMVCLCVFDTSNAETMVLGPFAITNSSTTYYPQFPSSTGYLQSVSFKISSFNIEYDIILDNDETNELSYDVDHSRAFNINNIPFAGIPGYGVAFGATNNLVGIISDGDDGDGNGSHDGGVDEVQFSISHSNLSGQVSSSLSSHLAYNTGSSQRGLIVLILSSFQLPIVTALELYIENQTYSGTLYVHYTYDNQPLVPELQTITFSSNSLVQLEIENLSVGSSNIIQRCFELGSNDWVDVESFISSSWSTNWTEEASNEWTSAFYRILSK